MDPKARAEIVENSDALVASSPFSFGSDLLSIAKASSESGADDLKSEQLPPGTLPPIGLPRGFLRRQKEEDGHSSYDSGESSFIPQRRKKKWDDELGPISESAIYPQRQSQTEQKSSTITLGKRAFENTGDNDDQPRMMASEEAKAEVERTYEQIINDRRSNPDSPINDGAEQRESRDRAPQHRRPKLREYEEEINLRQLQERQDEELALRLQTVPINDEEGLIDFETSSVITTPLQRVEREVAIDNDGCDTNSNSNSNSVSYSNESSDLGDSKAKSGTAATTVSGPHLLKKEIIQDTVPEPSYQGGYDENPYDDAETIMTDNEDIYLPPDTKEALVSSFSRGLCQNLDAAIGAQQTSVESVVKFLPEFLREFAIRLRKEANEEQQELATLFVRRYRGYVSSEFCVILTGAPTGIYGEFL